MRYCFFDGADVIGPLPADELRARAGFGAHSLVCPEEHSEEESYWKEAYLYPDFDFTTIPAQEQPAPAGAEAVEASQRVALSKAAEPSVDVADKQLSFLLFQASQKMGEDPSAPSKTQTPPQIPEDTAPASKEDVSVQLVSTARSPIEEYFNSMRTGDLENILGIPDPKLNSDLNLANMLEKQFEKTDPNVAVSAKKEEKDPFDSFVSSTPEELDTFLQERNQAATPEEKDLATQAQLQQDLQEKERVTASVWPTNEDNQSAETTQEIAQANISQQGALVVPLQEDDPNDKTVETILEGTLKVENKENELPEPIKRVKTPRPTATMPALEQGKVIVPTDPQPSSHWVKWVGMGAGLFLLTAGVLLHLMPLKEKEQPQMQQPTAQEIVDQADEQLAAAAEKLKKELEAQPVAAAPAPVQAPAPVAKTPEQQAVQIVQNYVLDDVRGTVKDFLTQQHAAQLSDGYAGVWSAEPLHRNTYVVRYRLSKIRQEPIVYVFQADTAKKKLTGALNNITLDLVGKIK